MSHLISQVRQHQARLGKAAAACLLKSGQDQGDVVLLATRVVQHQIGLPPSRRVAGCLLYTSDAADE